MARPREFDVEQVLDRAADVFRTRGYAATSVSDLEQATGVQRGSLYKAFGDKQGLYQQALSRYRARGVPVLDALSEAEPVLPAVRGFLLALATRGCTDPRRGCLVVTTVTERMADPASAAQVREQLAFMTSRLRAALQRAVVLGELAPDADVETSTHLLVTLVQGLRVMAMAGGDLDELTRVVDQALRVLPVPRLSAPEIRAEPHLHRAVIVERFFPYPMHREERV